MSELLAVSANNPSCEESLEEFDGYLAEVRGVRPGTRVLYRRHVREFLDARFPSGIVAGREISARDLFCYISEHAARGRVVTTKLAAAALRSFVRYLVIRGDCSISLIGSVPSVPNWKLSSLPRILSDEQVAALMKTFNRATPIGLRDYAIALCLARLGLRANEVARLSMDDVKWRSGSLSISAEKSRRASVMPILEEVGLALAAYVRDGRPPTKDRTLFVNHGRGSQKGTAITASAIGAVIRRAMQRSEIRITSPGAHTLRHTMASRMLRAGADLKEIADVLRHRSLNTTFVYTKVDLDRLAEVAQPWPVVTS